MPPPTDTGLHMRPALTQRMMIAAGATALVLFAVAALAVGGDVGSTPGRSIVIKTDRTLDGVSPNPAAWSETASGSTGSSGETQTADPSAASNASPADPAAVTSQENQNAPARPKTDPDPVDNAAEGGTDEDDHETVRPPVRDDDSEQGDEDEGDSDSDESDPSNRRELPDAPDGNEDPDESRSVDD